MKYSHKFKIELALIRISKACGTKLTMSLSSGAISSIFGAGSTQKSGFTPTLQVINIKLINSTSTTNAERYRLILSDGEHFQQVC